MRLMRLLAPAKPRAGTAYTGDVAFFQDRDSVKWPGTYAVIGGQPAFELIFDDNEQVWRVK